MKKRGFVRIACVALIAAMSLGWAGCSLGKGDSGKQTEEGAAGRTAGNGKIVVKAEHEDGAYVAEPVEFSVPADAGYQRSVAEDGTLWGVKEGGEIWGNPGIAEEFDFSNVGDFLMEKDYVCLVRYPFEKEFELRSLQGELLGKIDGKGGVIESVGGGPYVLRRAGEQASHLSICQVDVQKMALGEELTELPSDVRGIFKQGSDAENLYFYTADAAWRYSFAEQVFYRLFAWTDVGLFGGQIAEAWKNDAGQIFVGSFENSKIEYFRVSWKETAVIPAENEIIIAVLTTGSNGRLEQYAAEFNRSQQEWKVTVKPYVEKMDSEDWEDAKNRISADLLGDNPPDLIGLGNMSDLEDSLAIQGYLVDLRSFLKESTVISEEDFYPEILEYGSHGDLLYKIPQTFDMETLVVPASQWPGEAGWTYDDMIRYLREREEWRPFRAFFLMRMYCLRSVLDYFWDAETKRASFDSEEFQELLEYMKECQEKETTVSSEDRPFVMGTLNFSWLGAWPRLEEEIGECKVMGYPSPDGKPRTVIRGSMELSIATTSKKQEGAWKFLEFYLAREPGRDDFASGRLWSRKDLMEKMIEKELSLCGKDHEDILDENGEVIGAYYSEHKVDQRCVDAFREALAGIKKAPTGSAAVQMIVIEETNAYFDGQKSLEQVIDAIQKRVGLFLAE